MENELLIETNMLIYTNMISSNLEFDYIKENFCGKVKEYNDTFMIEPNIIVYICGDIQKIHSSINEKLNNNKIMIIKDYSEKFDQYENINNCTIIESGQVPINIYNTGIYLPKFFDDKKDYFNSIYTEHKFQNLSESNKPSNAHRNGIYLTNVTQDGEKINFNLLRCSTNLDGPTENFRDTDNEIVNKVNDISTHFFKNKTNLNHVLAQVYNNFYDNGVPKKARIKAHSDKTKDMPLDGLMAFCTFYKDINQIKNIHKNGYDYCYKNISTLTRMLFRLKPMVENSSMKKVFEITLYPNSVFIIPLSTNRLYTHEIVPSTLPLEYIPTRIGYVIRCSKTKAVFQNNETYLYDENEQLKKMEQMTHENMKLLRDLYLKENTTIKKITYGKWYSSMNNGDYQKPIL